MSIGASQAALRTTSMRSGVEVEDPPAPGRRRWRRGASTCSAVSGGRVAERPGGIADPGGEVADDEHRDVAEVLELAQLAQNDREAEMDVRGGRVDPELHPQRPAGCRAWSRSSARSMQWTVPAVRIRSCCVHGGHRARRYQRAPADSVAIRRARRGVPAAQQCCRVRRCRGCVVRARRSSRSSRRAAGTPRTCASPTTRRSSSQVLWADGSC